MEVRRVNVNEVNSLRRARSLALITCGQGSKLGFYFNSLDSDGWLIELVRVFVRYEANVELSHQEWSEYLTFPDAKSYRRFVAQALPIREALVTTARFALTLSGAELLTSLSNSAEFFRWARDARSYWREKKPTGRPLQEVSEVSSDVGRALEALRLKLGLNVRSFARKFGVSHNTYLRRLAYDEIPQEWIDAAEDIKVVRVNLVEKSYSSVDDGELVAVAVRANGAWNRWLEVQRGAQLATSPESTLESLNVRVRPDLEDDSLKFEPSPEDDSDGKYDVNVDLDAVEGSDVEDDDR